MDILVTVESDLLLMRQTSRQPLEPWCLLAGLFSVYIALGHGARPGGPSRSVHGNILGTYLRTSERANLLTKESKSSGAPHLVQI